VRVEQHGDAALAQALEELADEVLLLHQRLAGSDGGAAERARLLDAVGLGDEGKRRVQVFTKPDPGPGFYETVVAVCAQDPGCIVGKTESAWVSALDR